MSVTELIGGAIGILLFGLGAASVLAWSLARRRTHRILLLFGLWCGLYGVRQIAEQSSIIGIVGGSAQFWLYFHAFITYVINVPIVMFVEALIGSGYQQSVRRVWQVYAVYAFAAVVTDLLLGEPAAAMRPNSPLVLVGMIVGLANAFMFWPRLSRTFKQPIIGAGTAAAMLFVIHENVGQPLSPDVNLEPIGVFLFVVSLGYGVAGSVFLQETELVAVQRELETARRIQMSLLPRDLPKTPGLDVAALYQPMSSVGGDLYDFVTVGPSRFGIFVADVAGHGVPAALVASMVKLAFSTQADLADDPARVLSAVNRTLCRHVEHTYVTAIYAVFDTQTRTITVANAGHPPLLAGHSEAPITQNYEHGLMLGILPEAEYVNDRYDLRSGDVALVYTDGVTEAQSPSGDFLDLDRVRGWLHSTDGLDAAQFADFALRQLQQWRRAPTFDDDVTLVVARFI